VGTFLAKRKWVFITVCYLLPMHANSRSAKPRIRGVSLPYNIEHSTSMFPWSSSYEEAEASYL
jgi:hypothetical protein